jgi:hypothetical protein
MAEAEFVLFAVALAFFTGWLVFLSNKLSSSLDLIEGSQDQVDEIRDAVEVVVQLLSRLPEMMPSFALQQNSAGSVIAEYIGQLLGQRLNTVSAERDDNGRFSNGTEIEEQTS